MVNTDRKKVPKIEDRTKGCQIPGNRIDLQKKGEKLYERLESPPLSKRQGNENDDWIVIFISTDNKYAVPAYITLYSMLKNYKGNRQIKVYILSSGDLDLENKTLLTHLRQQFKFLDISIFNMGDSYNGVTIHKEYITTATMYRLLIPKILAENEEGDIKKCIYLDADIVVEGNIDELFNIDVEGYCIAGVRERAISCDCDDNLRDQLGLPSLKDYINAGVIVLNLDEIRRQRIDSKMEEAGLTNDYRYNDQDVINTVCYGRIKLLPIIYNAMTPYLSKKDFKAVEQYGYTNLLEAIRNPVIVHYIGSSKPWIYRNTVMADLWWNYYKMQDNEIKRKYLDPFIKEVKLPLAVQIKEYVRSTAIHLGVYEQMRILKKAIYG